MKMIRESKFFLYTMFLFLALLWGLSFFGTKVALEHLEPVEVLTVRWTISLFLFLLLVAFRVIKLDYKGKPLKRLALGALLQPCIYALFEAWGIQLTTASESSIFIAVIPLMVVLEGSVILREKVDKRVKMGIIVGFSGVITCVAFAPDFSVGGKLTGYVCLVLAVVTGAGYTLISHKLSKDFSTMEITFALALEGAVFFNFISFVQGHGLEPYELFLSGGKSTIALIYLGVGCSFLAYIIFNFTLSRLSAALATCIQTNLITSVGVLSGILFGGDCWGIYTIIGLALIITGILISSGIAGGVGKKEIP